MAKLEKELGLSNGYFYRNKISTKPRNIGIETVIDVAEYFKVDLEKLLYCNMEEEN